MTALPSADAIVVAAGTSRRMRGVDKLMAPLAGRPLLAWTLDALAAARSVGRLIVVAAPDRLPALAAEPWIRDRDAQVVPGGERRQDSVAAGLGVASAEVVLVHDGARPLVSAELVDRVALAAAEHGAAIPVVAVAETLKEVAEGRVGRTVTRDGLAIAQTPQGARRDLLDDAFARASASGTTFTDEAAVLEAAGIGVVAVEGDVANLKVTEPGDLGRAEAMLASLLGPQRVGFGADSHPFGPRLGLALGGISIDDAPGLEGHSDGDVALHAVADALLGAAAIGDLGRLFPAGVAETRDISSAKLLEEVVRTLRAARWQAVGIDVTIVGARPRLGSARLDSMRARIAELTGTQLDAVAVKASTGNLIGPEGSGRAISASAIVTVRNISLLG
jgi:2-C-methyl-D-erythritol 4-phosphate cytidylyltransferase/2-C-methyl-D-erythritol 2,4-cyclodiphosphate synthase